MIGFLSGQYGPGSVVMAEALDSQFRGAGIEGFKGAAPTPFKEWHVGAVWAEIEKSTDIDFASFTIGEQVYLGAPGTSSHREGEMVGERWSQTVAPVYASVRGSPGPDAGAWCTSW